MTKDSNNTAAIAARPSGIIRSDYFRSEATGRCYWVDRNGKATEVPRGDFEDAMSDSFFDETQLLAAAERDAWNAGGRDRYEAWDRS